MKEKDLTKLLHLNAQKGLQTLHNIDPQFVILLVYMLSIYGTENKDEKNKGKIVAYYCYKLVQGFRLTCLFSGQYNTKGYNTIIDVQLNFNSKMLYFIGS